VRDARRQAEQLGLGGDSIGAVLAPAEALVSDEDFWQHQDEGLALLLAPGSSRRLRVKMPFAEQVVVADRHHLKPLLPLDGDVEFELLALSQNHVRLFRGSRAELRLLPAADLPKSIAAALWMDDPERSLQQHGHREPHGMRTIHHGQGVTGNDERDKKNLQRYFRAIDRALLGRDGDRPLPLVLACVDYYDALFREVSEHPDVVAPSLAGNPDEVDAERLHAAAWELLAPRLGEVRDRAIARHRAEAGTGRTSDDLAAIVTASIEGRVQDLFVDVGRNRWGRPAPESVGGREQPELHTERRPGDVDLIDFAMAATIRNGGRAHAVDPDVVPLDGVAATFRY
jgi:hypothetical protein